MNWELDLYRFLVKSFFYALSDENPINNITFNINENYSIKINSEFKKPILSQLEIGKAVEKIIWQIKINEKIIVKEKISQSTWKTIRVLKEDFEIIDRSFKMIHNEIKTVDSSPNLPEKETKLPVKNSGSKEIILVCQLNSPNDFEVEKLLREKKSFKRLEEQNFRDLAFSIFAYWYGDSHDVPQNLAELVNNKDVINEELNNKYYIISFNNNNLRMDEVIKITKPSVYDREDAVKYLSKSLDSICISQLFSNIPDGCTIVSG